MSALGIRRVNPGVIMMWRPYCLYFLSSNAVASFRKGESYFIKWLWDELAIFEDLVRIHLQLLQYGMPMLVINFASLLWAPERTGARIQSFLPCLQKIDFSFQPKLGEHIFPANKFKSRQSIQSFASKFSPSKCCGYDVAEQECRGLIRENPQFRVLSLKVKKPDILGVRMHAAVNYLKVWSS